MPKYSRLIPLELVYLCLLFSSKLQRTSLLNFPWPQGPSCAILSDRTINCWGSNTYGQLGNGLTAQSVGPVEVSGISNAIKIDSTLEDGRHSCALLADGGVKCWGKGASGQLGNGADSTSTTPVYVSGFE